MFSLFNSVAALAINAVKVAAAPIEIVATVANAVVEPIADGLETVVKETKDLIG
jgi:hypothetical protein